MKVIWKFPIEIKERVEIKMPKGAKILTVQDQFDAGMIWAVVNPDAKPEVRKFSVLMTGFEIPKAIETSEKEYIGTFQTYAGNYVYHVFELQ